jgi:hypothetical protein
MDVNNQAESGFKESGIKRELRERKYLIENEILEGARPFKSYRRGRESDEQEERVYGKENKVSESGSPFKLRR